jgi:hypothetical protein
MQTYENVMKSITQRLERMQARNLSPLLRAYRTHRPTALTTPAQAVEVLVALELVEALVEKDVMEVGSDNDNGKDVDNDNDKEVDVGALGAVTVI